MLELGNSPAIQCLGVCTLAAEAQVQSRVGDLRSQKPLGLSKRKKKILEWSVAPKERLGHEQGDYHPPFFSSLPDLGACFFFFFFFFFRWETFLCAEEDTGQRADTFQSIPCSSQESPGKALLGHPLAQRTESSYSW